MRKVYGLIEINPCYLTKNKGAALGTHVHAVVTCNRKPIAFYNKLISLTSGFF